MSLEKVRVWDHLVEVAEGGRDGRSRRERRRRQRRQGVVDEEADVQNHRRRGFRRWQDVPHLQILQRKVSLQVSRLLCLGLVFNLNLFPEVMVYNFGP